MSWSAPLRRLPEALPVHLERFARQLGDLATDLRVSVAGLTGDAIGRAVRDGLLRFWGQTSRMIPSPTRDEEDPYGWPDDDWTDDSHSWEDRNPKAAPNLPTSVPSSRLAQVLQASGWLLQHGSLFGLFGVGAAVGGVLLLRGPLGVPGIDLIATVAEIATLIALLTNGPKQLLLN